MQKTWTEIFLLLLVLVLTELDSHGRRRGYSLIHHHHPSAPAANVLLAVSEWVSESERERERERGGVSWEFPTPFLLSRWESSPRRRVDVSTTTTTTAAAVVCASSCTSLVKIYSQLSCWVPVWPDWAIYWTLGNFLSLWQQLVCPNLPHS